MSAEKTFDQMTFFDFLAVARRHLDQLAACYTSGIAGDGHVEEFAELHKDAGWALALAGSRGTADLRDIEQASELAFTPEDVDGLPAELVDAILADSETGVLDLSTLHDDVPVWTETERAAAGDLLAPPSDGMVGIFGATSEIAGPQEDREDDTADRHDETTQDWNRLVKGRDAYRADHPFPIDPDEEVQW